MAIIAKIGQILNTPIKTGKVVKNSSNPFDPSTFKGSVLPADVFVSSKAKNKLKLSTFVGSIGDAFPTFRKGIESVAAFGKRMKEGFSSAVHKINEIGSTEISINFAGMGKAIKSGFTSMIDNYSVSKLRKNDPKTLEAMWKEVSGLNIAA